MIPNVQRCEVTCLGCGGMSRINIVGGSKVVYVDHTPIIACRLRGDMKWGFECMCGNDSRVAPQEKGDVKWLVQASAQGVVERIVEGLRIKDEKKFRLAEV